MGDLSASKVHRHFDPLAPLDKATNVSYFENDIMRVGTRAHLHFLDIDDSVLLCAMGLLLLFVAKLAVIHHATDRRLSIWRDLDQIEFLRFYHLQGFVQRQDAQLLALRTDHPNLAGANLMIDSRFSSDKPPRFFV